MDKNMHKIKPNFLGLILSCLLLCLSSSLMAGELDSNGLSNKEKIQCGNLIYAGTRSSICFSNKFLSRVSSETNIQVNRSFKDVKLDSNDLFDTPFCIISGENSFNLSKAEQKNLRKYLENGGFLLSSPNCSNKEWDAALRRTFKAMFPDNKFQKIDMDHAIFQMIYPIKSLHLKSGGSTKLEGLFINERLVMVHSKEGLNDVKNAKGCCCCGGNEIKEAQQVNVNILTYALLHW